jgi:hypothetical protein
LRTPHSHIALKAALAAASEIPSHSRGGRGGVRRCTYHDAHTHTHTRTHTGQHMNGNAEASADQGQPATLVRKRTRVMPEAKWTTHEVASGKSGVNQGGALFMLMQRSAHLMHLGLTISQAYDGDIHCAAEDGASAASLKAMRARMVPWAEYDLEVVEPANDMHERAHRKSTVKTEPGMPRARRTAPKHDPRADMAKSLQDMWAM